MSMRPLMLVFLLTGCATTSAEMIDSPAGRCISDADPAKQCCPQSGLDPTSPARPACPGAPLAVIEQGGASMPRPLNP